MRSPRSSAATAFSRCATRSGPSASPTSSHPDIDLGGSPRATVALYRVAQASAALDGRDFVTPDDVKRVAPAVLAHRLVVDLDRSLLGATADGVVAAILASTPAPPVDEA